MYQPVLKEAGLAGGMVAAREEAAKALSIAASLSSSEIAGGSASPLIFWVPRCVFGVDGHCTSKEHNHSEHRS